MPASTDTATTRLPATVSSRTVPQLLAAAVADDPGRAATIAHSLLAGAEVTLSYGELEQRAARMASVLGERGVGRGDRVLLLLANDGAADAHVAYHAVHRLGAINVPVNTFYVARELRYAIETIDPAAIVFAPAFAALVREAGGEAPSRALLEVSAGRPQLGEALGRLLDAAADDPPPVPVDEHEDADWLFTSGTTGHPKAVALTHANTVACGFQAREVWGLGRDSVYQNSSPFFTSTGCHTNMQATLAAGCTFVVDPEVDAGAIVERAQRHGTSSMFALTAILAILFRRLDDGRLAELELPALRRLVYGGQNMPRAFHDRIERHFEAERGVELAAIYGLTEGGTAGVWLTPDDHDEAVRRHGPYGLSIGRDGWNDWVEHRVASEEGEPVAPGEIGEIQLRAPSVMSRYVADERATEAALEGGWLRTGDMATIDDDGFLFFVDRDSSMIRRGGMNIAAAEVEAVVMAHPAVAEAAVVGRPNPVLGEDVHLVVVVKRGADVDAEALTSHCRAQLADYKVPRSISFVESLPRNAMGKISRAELKA